MENYQAMNNLLNSTFVLNDRRSLARVTIRNGRVQIRDLRPMMATLRIQQDAQELQKALRELREMFQAGDVQVIESRPDTGQASALQVHGRVKEEIEALPQEAVKVSEEGEEMDVAVESDDNVAWRTSAVALDRFFVTLIEEQEKRLVENTSTKQSAPSSVLRKRARQPLESGDTGPTTKSRERTRDTSQSRDVQESVTAAARKQQAAIRENAKEVDDEQEQQESLRKSRELRREAQGLGVSDPVKKAAESESTVEKIQKDVERQL